MNGNNKVIKIDEYEDIKNIALDILLKGKSGTDATVIINDLDDDEVKIRTKLLSVLDENINIIKPLFYIVDKCDVFCLKRVEKSDEVEGNTFTFALLDFRSDKDRTYIAEMYITVPDDENISLIWDASETELTSKNYVEKKFGELPTGNSSTNFLNNTSSLYLDEIQPGEYYFDYTPQSISIFYERGKGGVGLRGVQFANIHVYHSSKEDLPDGTVMASAATFVNSVMQHSIIKKDSSKSVNLTVVSNGYDDIALNGKNQNITGLKTFKKLPQSSVTPVDDKDLVNKSYVDTAIDEKITSVLESDY